MLHLMFAHAVLNGCIICVYTSVFLASAISSFNRVALLWLHSYIACCNGSKVDEDGTEVDEEGDEEGNACFMLMSTIVLKEQLVLQRCSNDVL